MTRFPDWTAGETAVAAKLDQASFDFVLKTADESVTSSTTLQNDNHLAATISATGTYVFDCWIFADSAANAAGDIAVGFSFPTGTLHFTGNGPHNSVASGSQVDGEWIVRLSATSGTTNIPFGLSTTTMAMQVHGILIATATGTLQMMWAQLASNASASTIRSGSHLIVKQHA